MKYAAAMITIAICFSLINCTGVRAEMFLKEVMPDPDDICRDCTEWVEIYIDEVPCNLMLDTGGRNNSIFLNESGYFVITGNKTVFSTLWGTTEKRIIDGKMSLNNNGDCIFLYSNMSIVDSFCYNHSERNNSWMLCGNEWVMSEKPTPGYDNECPLDEINKSLLSITGWVLTPSNPSINEQVNISVMIENNSSESINVSLFIVIEDLGLNISCGVFEFINETNITINCSWFVHEGLGIKGSGFEAYPQIEYSGSKIVGSSKTIVIECFKDAGDPFIVAFDPIESIRFGDFAIIKSLFYTGNINSPVRIVTYIYKPRWASIDSEGNTIRSHLNNSKNALLIKDIEMGENITLYLPLFIKWNCGGEYLSGIYQGRVRIYEDGTDDIVTQDKFNISLMGNNQLLCSSGCPRCEKQSSGNTYSSWCNYEAPALEEKIVTKKSERDIIKIISFQDNLTVGNILKTVVHIDNYLNVTGNFSIYSYVFNGSRCVSLGFDGKSWKNVWHANKNYIKIANDSSINITLENMIENGTDSGTYKLRVRLKFRNRSVDISEFVYVSTDEISFPESSNLDVKETNHSLSASIAVSGMFTEKKQDLVSILLEIFNNIATWLISIFKFY